jgi:hypothetical protein
VIVKASAQIDVSQSASATVKLVASENARLEGRYAFQFNGLDSNGIYQSAGTFTADGEGNIAAGLEDINSNAGPATSTSFTGTYQAGSDNRGMMTFSTASGTQTFRFALNVTARGGRFIEFDSTGIRGSGSFEQQDSSAFAVSALKGAYVLSLSGKDSAGNRIGALGIVDLDGQGSIFGGSMDVNDGGVIAPTYASFSGIDRVDSTSRGILNLIIPGLAGGSFRFAFYVVSAQKLFLVSVDPLTSNNPIFSGPVELQSGAPYLTSSFSGPTVFGISGEQGGTTKVTAGTVVFNSSTFQPLVQFDENTGGAATTGNVLTGGYSVGVNGPGVLNLDDSNNHTRTWEIYAIAPNHAFVMDTSTAYVEMGELDAQTTTPPFSNADLLGSYVLGSGEPLVQSSTLDSGVTSFNGKGAMSGMEDISQNAASLPAQALTGTYSLPGSSNNGSGTLTLTAPSGKSIALWVASPSQVFAVEIDSSNAQPVLLYLDQ